MTLATVLRDKPHRNREVAYKVSQVLDQHQVATTAGNSVACAVWHYFDAIGHAATVNPPGDFLPTDHVEAIAIAAVLAGLSAREARGWARVKTLHQVRAALARSVGPVIIGLPWHEGMMVPDPEGYVYPVGARVTGQAVCVVAYSKSRRAFRILNSLGPAWGQMGRAWLYADHLESLLPRAEAVALHV